MTSTKPICCENPYQVTWPRACCHNMGPCTIAMRRYISMYNSGAFASKLPLGPNSQFMAGRTYWSRRRWTTASAAFGCNSPRRFACCS